MAGLLDIALHGDLNGFWQANQKVAAKAITIAIRSTTKSMKLEMRRQIKAAKMGDRLGNTWRGDVLPQRGYSLDTVGKVYSKADFMIIFETGGSISAKPGKWLCIPTEAAGYSGNRRLRIKDFNGQNLMFVPTRKPDVGRLVLCDGTGKETTMFILVKQVKLGKRIDFEGEVDKYYGVLADRILASWEREAQKGGLLDLEIALQKLLSY